MRERENVPMEGGVLVPRPELKKSERDTATHSFFPGFISRGHIYPDNLSMSQVNPWNKAKFKDTAAPQCQVDSILRHHLTLYQSMTHICVMSSHKPIRIYMGGFILDVNTCTGFSASLTL